MKSKPMGFVVWIAALAVVAALWFYYQSSGNSVSASQAAAAKPAAKATAAAASSAKPYPFATSVVSGLAFGPKDTIVTLEQDGYQVKLASAAEADTFKKSPAVYMAKITDAYKTAKPCPMTVCPVMGDKLDADAFAFVYEGREFKFCCDACLDDFNKDPAKFVQMWDDAAAGKPITPTSLAVLAPTPTTVGSAAVDAKK